MKNAFILIISAAAIAAAPVAAQTFQRRASLTGSGNPAQGKCTIEVVVDGQAEVEIRGDNATLRNLGGQPPQWRRFECTGRMPDRPADFRFQGIDGRGRQQLMNDPRNGGPAVVRIEDPQSGAEGYTFDILWSGGSGYPADQRPYSERGFGNDGRFDNRQYSSDRAVRMCQDAVMQRSNGRFGRADLNFRDTRFDNDGNRVNGILEVRGDRGEDHFRFSCLMDLNRGQVRSADVEPLRAERDFGPAQRDSGGPADRNYSLNGADRRAPGTNDAVEICRRAVTERIAREGYEHVRFDSIRIDDRRGGNDSVTGIASGENWGSFEFSCRVNLDTGEVRSVDLNRSRRYSTLRASTC